MRKKQHDMSIFSQKVKLQLHRLTSKRVLNKLYSASKKG